MWISEIQINVDSEIKINVDFFEIQISVDFWNPGQCGFLKSRSVWISEIQISVLHQSRKEAS